MSFTCQKIVLIACGSFNPITNMHLRMFELAKDFLQRSGKHKVLGGIISPVNDRYNKTDLENSIHRTAMIQLALKSSDWIRLDKWETQQDCWVETLKVLKHHQSILDSIVKRDSNKRRRIECDSLDNYVIPTNLLTNEEGQIRLVLLCGADLLESFAVPNLWKDQDIEDIVSNFGLICISRKGSNAESFIYESDVLSKYQNNISLITEWITNDISSTKIRRALRRGESVKYLLQDSVIEYIKDNRLYKAAETSHK